MRVVLVRRRKVLIEDIPMPEFSVTAQIELAGAYSAYGHADFFQFRAAVNGWFAPREERLHPGGIEFFVGWNELLKIGRGERPRRHGQSR
jgi:hypothetical protein